MTQPNDQTEKEKLFTEMFKSLFDLSEEDQQKRLDEWYKNIEHTGFRKVKIDEGGIV